MPTNATGRLPGVARARRASDPEPARRVRRALARDLSAGVPWSQARWEEILRRHGADYTLALRSTRWAWQEAYEHQGERLMTV